MKGFLINGSKCENLKIMSFEKINIYLSIIIMLYIKENKLNPLNFIL